MRKNLLNENLKRKRLNSFFFYLQYTGYENLYYFCIVFAIDTLPIIGKERMTMKIKDIINNPGFKKGVGVASVLFAGITAISSAISDQKKEQEFEDLKKAVSDLQNK